MEDSRRNSVKHLASLYTVVVGLALASGINNLINTEAQPVPFKIDTFLTFLAFLVTLIPFYHGALRHLDITYIEDKHPKVRDGALMVDFAILFVEGCFFLALSVLLVKPITFAWGIALLLVVDVMWGFFAHLAFSPDKTSENMKPEGKWSIINLITIVILLFYLISNKIYPNSNEFNMVEIASLIFILLSIRSIFDYICTWKVYFPSDNSNV